MPGGPRKLGLLGRGSAVFGSYAKVLLAEEVPVAFSQFGPLSAYPRAQLMVEVRRLIRARKLTQRAAAKLLGVTQPRISDLIRGKIDLFSIDTLVNMLARGGMRVKLRISVLERRRRAQAA